MKKHNRIFLFCLFLYFLSFTVSVAQGTVTHIPSSVADPKGLAVYIIPPLAARYAEGAPVVVDVVGGFDANGLPAQPSDFVLQGFIEVHFSWPGLGIVNQDIDVLSGGSFDFRGENCITALKDVILFAMGEKADKDGNEISHFTSGITPLMHNVGALSFSNGGNATLVTAGLFGDSIPTLAWLVNYESPVGDGMPGTEAGTWNSRNPLVNAAYDTLTGDWDLSTLAYSDTLNIMDHCLDPPGSVKRGGLYFDFNQNAIPDFGSDFILSPIKMATETDTLAFYSERVHREAVTKGIFPDPLPDHIASAEETIDFWSWRNGEKYIADVVDKIHDLMFMAVAYDKDHAQSAPDHPHVLIQYDGFLKAPSRFVRLNPDRCYVENIMGQPLPWAKDNDAFTEYDHVTIKSAVEPKGLLGLYPLIIAAACELADRTRENNVSPQLENVLTGVHHPLPRPGSFCLFQNIPNPFNPATEIRFHAPTRERVTLTLYDTTGRRVKVIWKGIAAVGTNAVKLDASSLASGVYLVRLEAGPFAATRKLIVQK